MQQASGRRTQFARSQEGHQMPMLEIRSTPSTADGVIHTDVLPTATRLLRDPRRTASGHSNPKYVRTVHPALSISTNSQAFAAEHLIGVHTVRPRHRDATIRTTTHLRNPHEGPHRPVRCPLAAE